MLANLRVDLLYNNIEAIFLQWRDHITQLNAVSWCQAGQIDEELKERREDDQVSAECLLSPSTTYDNSFKSLYMFLFSHPSLLHLEP